MTTNSSLTHFTDADLLTAVAEAASHERTATAHLLTLLAALDTRRLYLGAGCSSLFNYCTQVIFLSEHAAYRRIEAARCARRFPVVLERLAEGALTLTTITLLAPHLTSANVQEVLTAVGLIRFRGHNPKGGYDVPDVRYETEANSAKLY